MDAASARRGSDSSPVTATANGEPVPLTIGQVARRSGFTVKALRFYDRRGLLPPSARRRSGYRLYDEADLHRLEFIRQAKALGLSLESIKQLIVTARSPTTVRTRTRLLAMLDNRIAQNTAQITSLNRLRRALCHRRSAVERMSPRRPGAGYCTCLQPSR
jgi:DNA-binding transcriptional MerR regulator